MTKLIATLLVLSACDNPQPSQTEEVEGPSTIVIMPSTPKPAPVAPAPEQVKEAPPPPKAKEGPLTERQCKRLNTKFTQCGWRCSNRGGNPERCVNQCGHLLTPKGRRCIHYWGLDFS